MSQHDNSPQGRNTQIPNTQGDWQPVLNFLIAQGFWCISADFLCLQFEDLWWLHYSCIPFRKGSWSHFLYKRKGGSQWWLHLDSWREWSIYFPFIKVHLVWGLWSENTTQQWTLCAVQFNLKSGGQRVATMLMYLSDRVEGGETYFPWVGATLYPLQTFATYQRVAREGILSHLQVMVRMYFFPWFLMLADSAWKFFKDVTCWYCSLDQVSVAVVV